MRLYEWKCSHRFADEVPDPFDGLTWVGDESFVRHTQYTPSVHATHDRLRVQVVSSTSKRIERKELWIEVTVSAFLLDPAALTREENGSRVADHVCEIGLDSRHRVEENRRGRELR
jgi:hypothetical protein